MCHFSLMVWIFVLFYEEAENDGSYVTSICITLRSICAVSFALACLIVKWNYYKMTYKSIIFFCLGGMCFLAYQIVGVSYFNNEESFFAITVVFLNCNAIVIIFIIFLNESRSASSFFTMLHKNLGMKFEEELEEEDLIQLYQTLDKKSNLDY